jgi:hypothetical protein
MPEGPWPAELVGTKHTRVPSGVIRAATALAGGGGKMSAVRALLGRKA